MRSCGAEDLEKLIDFYRRVIRDTPDIARRARWEFGRHPTGEGLAAYIGQGAMYAAGEGGEIAAAAAVTPFQTEEYHGVRWQRDLRDDEAAVVHLFAVDPLLQGRGVGKAFLREIIAMAGERGFRAVRLDAMADNIPAHRLFAALGFRQCDERRWYAENTGWFDFYLFEYLL